MRNERKYLEEERSLISFRSLRVFMFVCLLLFGIVYLATRLLSVKSFPVRVVEVGGQFRYVNQKVLKRRITPLIKGNFFTIDIKAIHDAVSTVGWVGKVSITRVWPDRLRIHIVEDRPLARLQQRRLITRSGKTVTVRTLKPFAYLPVFRAPGNYYPVMVKKYLAIRKTLGSAGMRISRVTVTPRRAWRLLLRNGVKIRLGRDRVVFRADRLARAYSAILKKKVGDIQAIDMRYTNGFAVKWKSSKKTKNYAFGG